MSVTFKPMTYDRVSIPKILQKLEFFIRKENLANKVKKKVHSMTHWNIMQFISVAIWTSTKQTFVILKCVAKNSYYNVKFHKNNLPYSEIVLLTILAIKPFTI